MFKRHVHLGLETTFNLERFPVCRQMSVWKIPFFF